MNKIILLFLLISKIFAMPQIIQNYNEITIANPSASKMKDIISPTKEILAKASEIYDNELDDFKATVKIEKYRNLKAQNHTFLINKKIYLEDVLIDINSIDNTISPVDILNIKKGLK